MHYVDDLRQGYLRPIPQMWFVELATRTAIVLWFVDDKGTLFRHKRTVELPGLRGQAPIGSSTQQAACTAMQREPKERFSRYVLGAILAHIRDSEAVLYCFTSRALARSASRAFYFCSGVSFFHLLDLSGVHFLAADFVGSIICASQPLCN